MWEPVAHAADFGGGQGGMPPDGSVSRGASTSPSGCWGEQLARRPHLDPLPGNGEAGLLRQVGGTPFDGWWWDGALPEGEPHWIYLWEQRSCVSSSQ